MGSAITGVLLLSIVLTIAVGTYIPLASNSKLSVIQTKKVNDAKIDIQKMIPQTAECELINFL